MNVLGLGEFVEAGYLQEVNRQFFHPLGLALVVFVSDEGEYTLGGILDARDDPDGFVFDTFDDFEIKRGRAIEAMQYDRMRARRQRLGFNVQPHDTRALDYRVEQRLLKGDTLHLTRHVYDDGSTDDHVEKHWCGGDGKCEKQCGGCARL